MIGFITDVFLDRVCISIRLLLFDTPFLDSGKREMTFTTYRDRLKYQVSYRSYMLRLGIRGAPGAIYTC